MKIHPYYYSWQKRAFDIVTALLLCVATIPLCVVISIVIFLTSGTPVFFTQSRMGKNKQPFTMYKFRTMQLGAEKYRKRFEKYNEAPSPMFKIKDDPRFTTFGKWFSRSGLDEIPQLLNVLKGDMSLVGPRPLPISEAELLPKSWDFRYQVLPGLYSKWAIYTHKYISLKHWKNIEETSLQNGSVLSDILLFFRIIFHISLQFINLKKLRIN